MLSSQYTLNHLTVMGMASLLSDWFSASRVPPRIKM